MKSGMRNSVNHEITIVKHIFKKNGENFIRNSRFVKFF